MFQVQSGIMPEHCRTAIWLEGRFQGDLNALRTGCRRFADDPFQAQYMDAHLGAVVAFGHDLWR